MFSTLVVTILIFNLAVNEGSFVNLINDDNDQLKPEYTINSTCRNSLECSGKLLCLDGNCQCVADLTWNGTNCITRKAAKQECSKTEDCQPSLSCFRQICQCPSSDFWNGSICTLRKTVNSTCYSYPECKESLECKEDICQCRENDYWDGSYCVIKKLPGMKCSAQFECRTELPCFDGTCNCPDIEFLKEHKCLPNLPSECQDIDIDTDGVYSVYPKGKTSSRRISVYCIIMGKQKWTVIQRRYDGSVDFYRSLSEYIKGFGRVDKEHWLGLDNIHRLSIDGTHELSVVLEDWEGQKSEANYSKFKVYSGNSYSLDISGYSGTAGDSLHYSNGYSFYTFDRDYGDCAKRNTGAFWFQSGECYRSNLNGKYNGTGQAGVYWNTFGPNHSLKSSIMMIRRR
ncbi:Tenascin-R,Angiopoietin-related protein 2,Fibrinogen C domain-containing protein 1,Microfibril-associated glycoprotein 4 [Mytilus coruscus]|uniref:Tenascin-R,Angiopoietin-related protein 2,Fibrinogen C domain-containing protein 1,Microfibril-associated glycoprotein 4 n=1 Tax=Mytilus coruscus TaxID=42192 RepID=A0A6J8BLJ8_MYTCO|nr:Tenascin-R,Angiopoietin-related protein 2,Fibrinogen C domain-containing protein 1,Microfibril-associated glycoprotein 4 [Mytilus coruscus]